MISIEKFQEIRSSKHLIILDTNIFLELYRQPANISLDVIRALKEVQDNIYIPRQVYDEYIKHYCKVNGDEKKKYKKVTRELSNFLQKLQDDITVKIGEYRKHNYTDISKLQDDLLKKIKDIQTIIDDFENTHSTEIQLNIDFLEKDKVKEFVDLLASHGKIGDKILFSQKLQILHEGQVRYDNLIPPGFLDSTKGGKDKYGDLFIWKNIITIAKEKNSNIIFVCNDTKEDWWEKDKETPLDLRYELEEEFKETNPSLNISFLTLDKFFSYLAEELKIGKSKSALQLSAMEDIKCILDYHKDAINQNITDYLLKIDIRKELDEDFLECGAENIYWNVTDVSVEKEDKKIVYYVNLDISLLADLIQQNEDDSYEAGKIALSLIGHAEIIMEEYSTVSDIRTISIEKGDILHIKPEVWNIVKDMENKKSCKDIISTSKNIININDTATEIHNTLDIDRVKGIQQYARIYESLSGKSLKSNKALSYLAKQASINQQSALSGIKSLQDSSALSYLAKQASINQQLALSGIKSLQNNSALSELATQTSLNKTITNTTNKTE